MKTSRNNIFDRFNEMEKYFAEYDIDSFVTHQHWEPPILLQILFFKFCGIKTVVQFHHDLNFFVNNILGMKSYLSADAVINPSQTAAKYWENFGVRSYYIPHPIEIDGAENFHGRDAKKLSKTILWVGRIAENYDKNAQALMPILKEVATQIPDVKLKLVGRVENQTIFAQMQAFIRENHLEKNVEFCGYQTDVKKFYESADVFLNTSPSESFCLAIAESKFYELPLVLYDLERLAILRDGKGYIAVEQGDFRGAAQAIVKILTDTELRCKLSAEARESIQPFLDYDIAGAWQRVFEDLENDVPAPPHKFENEAIQKFFADELWQKQLIINNLVQHINRLESKN